MRDQRTPKDVCGEPRGKTCFYIRIRSTTQIWVVTLHLYGFSALVLHTTKPVASRNVGCFRGYVSYFMSFSFRLTICALIFSSYVILFLSDAERKLAFLDVEGFDIFGKNSLFVPLIKWKALKEDVDTIQKAAEVYENTFNDIITSVKNKENFKQVIQLYQVFLQVRTSVYSSPQL